MEGELNITEELKRFIQILSEQPCLVKAVAEMNDQHVVCETWNMLRDATFNGIKDRFESSVVQTYNENDVIIPESPTEKYVMMVMLLSMVSEVVEQPKSENSAEVIDFKTRKRINK